MSVRHAYFPASISAEAVGVTLDPTQAASLLTFRPVVYISFSGTFDVRSDDDWDIAIFVDGAEIASSRRNVDLFGGVPGFPTRLDGLPVHIQALVRTLTIGVHTFDVRWKANTGTARAVAAERSLIVHEV